jgi:hypothetical protein
LQLLLQLLSGRRPSIRVICVIRGSLAFAFDLGPQAAVFSTIMLPLEPLNPDRRPQKPVDLTP